jgi:hypothetical protein
MVRNKLHNQHILWPLSALSVYRFMLHSPAFDAVRLNKPINKETDFCAVADFLIHL